MVSWHVAHVFSIIIIISIISIITFYCIWYITSKVLEDAGVCVCVWGGGCDQLGGITQIVMYDILSRTNSSLNHQNRIFVPKLDHVDSIYTAGSKLQ